MNPTSYEIREFFRNRGIKNAELGYDEYDDVGILSFPEPAKIDIVESRRIYNALSDLQRLCKIKYVEYPSYNEFANTFYFQLESGYIRPLKHLRVNYINKVFLGDRYI